MIPANNSFAVSQGFPEKQRKEGEKERGRGGLESFYGIYSVGHSEAKTQESKGNLLAEARPPAQRGQSVFSQGFQWTEWSLSMLWEAICFALYGNAKD